ncbi:MAG: polysaccharide deacetylase family protein [Rubrivivax sp.]|jgi:peptidoglycan/xylan/chitin deacetylase (PgdA/CDA1 family)|nr:polysaccharide deacetylase family protein [Rubrivivax sp.]
MTRDTLVLMYHAIPGGSGPGIHADGHYSVTLSTFRRHLDMMVTLGLKPRSVKDLLDAGASVAAEPVVALTFDDGHESNFAAYAEIVRRGGSADLFVNPGTVGTKGYLSWAQLRELARYGASIQSHSLHHVFLDSMPAAEVQHQISESRWIIEDQLGIPPCLFAPPNGRMPAGMARLAFELGYRAVCSSRVGVWRRAHTLEIPRFAVLAGTSDAQLAGWLRRSPWHLGLSLARGRVLTAGKRWLGEGRYQAVRRRLLGA